MDMNNLTAGWHRLREQLLNMGYVVETVDNNSFSNCEGIIFFNSDSIYTPLSLSEKLKNVGRKLFNIPIKERVLKRDTYTDALQAGLRDKMVLVLWEPKTVLPLNFHKTTWDKFDHILTWDDDLIASDKKFSRFFIPMEGNPVLEHPVPFAEKKLLVNVSYNKYSSYTYELYSERVKTIDYFSTHYPNDFDLFGPRWNIPVTRFQLMFPWTVKKYGTYRGKTEKKLETLSQYKFNLCYENTSDAQGYVCDKIFTSFHARSVPIYWGASNIADYVDPDTFIDRRQFKSQKEMAEFLTHMTEQTYNEYLKAGERYMESEKYAQCLPESFSKPIIKALSLTQQN